MKRLRNISRLLALAGVLGLGAWGCSTDSPTAPRQTPAPPAPPGQSFSITVSASPTGVALPEDLGNGETPTGTESTTMEVVVNSPVPANGTTMLITTSLGSFDSVGVLRSLPVALSNGRAFFTLFAGGLPVQLGVANVRATLSGSQGQLDVPINFLSADFCWSNPEANNSINFSGSSAVADTFLWDFGDGTTETGRNPHHVFDGPAVFSVRLTVSRPIGGQTLQTSRVMQVDTADTSCDGGGGTLP